MHYQDKLDRQKRVRAWGKWVKHYADNGWKIYYVNFMFCHLGTNHRATRETMRTEVERIYRVMVPQVIGKAKSEDKIRERPVLLGCPDLPVHKRDRSQVVSDFQVNDGYHFNSMVLTPPNSRIERGLGAHMEANPLYVGGGHRPYRIDVTRVRNRFVYVTRYTLKGIESGTVADEDLLLLPQSVSEYTSIKFKVPSPKRRGQSMRKYQWGKRELRGFHRVDFERDIAKVAATYERCGRSRDDIYGYLGDAYRMWLRWQTCSDPRQIFSLAEKYAPEKFVGNARTNVFRLIVKLTALGAKDNYQSKYVAALTFAQIKGATRSDVEAWMKNASCKSAENGMYRGLNACVELLKAPKMKKKVFDLMMDENERKRLASAKE